MLHVRNYEARIRRNSTPILSAIYPSIAKSDYEHVCFLRLREERSMGEQNEVPAKPTSMSSFARKVHSSKVESASMQSDDEFYYYKSSSINNTVLSKLVTIRGRRRQAVTDFASARKQKRASVLLMLHLPNFMWIVACLAQVPELRCEYFMLDLAKMLKCLLPQIKVV